MKEIRVLTVIGSLLLVYSCVSHEPAIVNTESSGNTESGYELTCVAFEEITNRHTPADLYPAVRQCLRAEQYQQATLIYAVALAFGAFDRQRVRDGSDSPAISRLQSTLWELPRSTRDTWTAYLKSALQYRSSELARICAHLRNLGPPDYEPTYMFEHETDTASADSLQLVLEPVVRATIWEDVITSFITCW